MTRLAIGLIGASFLLRLLMVFLPELGRDEAVYLYWTHHPRLDYSPLLQLQILLTGLISDAPWVLRFAQLAISGLSAWFFWQWLRDRGGAPWIGTAAFVTMPWLVFTGGVLHPDGLFVAGVLMCALGFERRQVWLTAAGAVIAAGAKLTGFVPLAVALVWLWQLRAWRPLMLVLAAAIAFGSLLEPATFAAARDFARIDTGMPGRLGLLLLEVALIGGVLLVTPRWRRSPVSLTGALLIAGFAAATITNGQVKANWVLPGLLLLWSTSIPRGVLMAFAVVATLLSGAMVVGYTRPSLAASAESRLAGIAPAYSLLAGEREARASSADSWADYLSGFHSRVEWPVVPLIPDEIVSDDYGIACRLALECPGKVPVVVVPGDPLFEREPTHAVGRQLIVAVRVDPAELSAGAQPGWAGSWTHPVTGETIEFLLIEDVP